MVLEPTEMPLGMELQLSAQQSVLRYNFRTEEQFIDKICACPDLAACKEFSKQPESAGVVKIVSDESPAAAAVSEKRTVSVESKRAPEKADSSAAAKTAQAAQQKTQGNRKLLALAACVLGVVAIVLICLFALPGNGAPEDSGKNNEMVVHVKLPESWTDARLRAWSDPSGREAFDEWPGLPLEMGADGWYIGTVPSWVNRISITGDNGAYESLYAPLEGKDVWVTVREDNRLLTSNKAPAGTKIKVYASVNTLQNPHCWAWTANGDVFDVWPGEPMTASGDWYTIELPKGTVGIIISDQTVDFKSEDLILESGFDVWFYECDTYYLWDHREIPEDALKEAFDAVGADY